MTAAQRWTVALVCGAAGLVLLDITIVNVALPAMRDGLGASFVELQWVVDAYTVALAAAVLGAGAAADVVGRRRVFTVGLGLFTAASVVCALAPSVGWLLAGRALQGTGAALVFATSLAILSAVFPGPGRARAFAAWGVVSGVAISLGPVLGGLLATTLGWRAVFWAPVPVAVAALVLAPRKLPEWRGPAGGRVDVLAVVLLAVAVGGLVVAVLEGLPGLLVPAAAALAGFVVRELRARRPLLDVRLLRERAFGGLQAMTLLLAFGFTSVFGVLALWFQGIEGLTPLQSGLAVLPVNALSALTAPLGGALVARWPVGRTLALGLALIGLGLLQVATVDVGDGWSGPAPGLALMGIGLGVASPAGAHAAVAVAPPERAGMASGANDLFRQVGTALGIAVLGSVLHTAVEARLPAGAPVDAVATAQATAFPGAAQVFTEGFALVFVLAGATVLLAALVAAISLQGVARASSAGSAAPSGPAPA